MTQTTKARSAALALAFALTQPATAARDSIERVATLNTARAAHTSTALRSGQVLIAGGMSNGGGLASAELFDPGTGTVRDIGTMTEARIGHTATLLPDGRVLIAGGLNGAYLGSVEIFDPRLRRFARAGSLVEPRSGHTATLLPDGRVLFAGGVGQGWTFLRTAEIYDPNSGRSIAVGAMRSPRESHTATLLEDGRVLVIGGHAGRRQNMEVYGTAEAWNPRTQLFEAAGVMGIPRHKHDAIMMADGRVLVIAGADRTDRNHFSSTEVYDPGSGVFTPGPSMANSRYKIAGTSVLLPNGDVLVTSGARSAELLDRRTGAFREIPGSFPDAYRFAAATQLPGGRVVITGGYSDGNRNTAGVWQFAASAAK